VCYNHAIRIDGKDGVSYYNRGVANYNLNKKVEACNDWKKAKELGIKESEELISKYCK